MLCPRGRRPVLWRRMQRIIARVWRGLFVVRGGKVVWVVREVRDWRTVGRDVGAGW